MSRSSPGSAFHGATDALSIPESRLSTNHSTGNQTAYLHGPKCRQINFCGVDDAGVEFFPRHDQPLKPSDEDTLSSPDFGISAAGDFVLLPGSCWRHLGSRARSNWSCRCCPGGETLTSSSSFRACVRPPSCWVVRPSSTIHFSGFIGGYQKQPLNRDRYAALYGLSASAGSDAVRIQDRGSVDELPIARLRRHDADVHIF